MGGRIGLRPLQTPWRPAPWEAATATPTTCLQKRQRQHHGFPARDAGLQRKAGMQPAVVNTQGRILQDWFATGRSAVVASKACEGAAAANVAQAGDRWQKGLDYS